MRVLRAFVRYLLSPNLPDEWTTPPRGGGPMLDDELDRAREAAETPRSLP